MCDFICSRLAKTCGKAWGRNDTLMISLSPSPPCFFLSLCLAGTQEILRMGKTSYLLMFSLSTCGGEHKQSASHVPAWGENKPIASVSSCKYLHTPMLRGEEKTHSASYLPLGSKQIRRQSLPHLELGGKREEM